MKAALHIHLQQSGGITRMGNTYVESPFKLVDFPGLNENDEKVVMIMNASPGILDGDDYHIRIHLESGAALRLQTQAYQRIFNMRNGAHQHTEVHLGEQASLVYLPHPCVPHEQSIFTCRNDFFLEKHHRLIFGEVLTCGRKHNGESFLFSSYHSHSRIYLNKQIIISENLLMEPALIPPMQIGQLEGFSHQATMIILDNHLAVKETREALAGLLRSVKGVEFGLSATPANGLLIRLLGHGAEKLYQLLLQLEQIITSVVTKPSGLKP